MERDLRSYMKESRDIGVCPYCDFEHNPRDFMIQQAAVGLVLCPGCGNKLRNLKIVRRW